MEKDDVQPGERRSRPATPWRSVWRIALTLLCGGLGYIGGLISGSSYGGNYVPDFSFLNLPGYEGSASMAAVVSAGALLLVAGLSLSFKRGCGRAWLGIPGALVGILVGPPLFFPVIAPSVELFGLTYVGCAGVGALIGVGLGALIDRRPATR
jgi:hypothetical protein